MTPSLNLFLQPDHLARLYINEAGTLSYCCYDLNCRTCPMYEFSRGATCLANSYNLHALRPDLLNLHPELFL